MKVKITKPDGTVLELECTPEELNALGYGAYLPFAPINVPISIPSVFGPVDICQHDFPSPWHGTIPPSCMKCGQQAYGSWTITTVSNTGDN